MKSVDKMKITFTSDSSHTLFSKQFNENYHSTYGAIQESLHIFIEAGLNSSHQTEIQLLEIGFGTGLNALLALDWSIRKNKKVDYFGIEAFPVDSEILAHLNYCEKLQLEKSVFDQIHASKGTQNKITSLFSACIQNKKIQDMLLPNKLFDVVFFDAFSPEVQPEMWEVELFQKIGFSMKAGGILTTYSSKGMVKRALQSAGFSIEKLPGPPGKREFLRATRL
jgi:tRNA U34 5-methylaminomethyl-2-thiouridine-forming methyltransferase MnmC